MKNKEIDKDDKRRKKKILKRVLLAIIIILIIVIAWFIYKTHKNGGGLSGMLATAVGHDENTKKSLDEIKVLILGVSTDLADAELTDTIMIASYNPNKQTANLLSIPRDTFTGKYPSKAVASQKINCLYNITGGPEQTLEAVNEITGLDIQYYVIVRTEALIKLVDAIGGVEFNVPIDMYYKDPTQDLVIDLKQGLQVLNGDKAEQLLRWRHSNYKNGVMTTYPSEYGNDDFGRMRTQRDFIVATLKQTLKPGNIFKIGELLEIAKENVETNLDFSYVKDYVPYAVEFNTDNINTATLPGTTPDIKETNNVSVFVVDKEETEKLIQSMFYKDSIENEITNTVDNTIEVSSNISTQIEIELLNGSGDKTKLEEAKKLLEDAGYKVKKTGSVTTISKTIITNKKDVTDENLKEIKETLGVGSISTNKSSTSLVDVSIIIGKDF